MGFHHCFQGCVSPAISEHGVNKEMGCGQKPGELGPEEQSNGRAHPWGEAGQRHSAGSEQRLFTNLYRKTSTFYYPYAVHAIQKDISLLIYLDLNLSPYFIC